MTKKKIRGRKRKMVTINFANKNTAELERLQDSFNSFINKEQTCVKCGKCCSAFAIPLTQDDLDREPKLLAVSHPITLAEQIKYSSEKHYCRMTNTTDDDKRCPLYDNSIKCSIYETRPNACREYIPSYYKCLYGRLGRVGYSLKSWYRHNVDVYCETKLHRDTGLDPAKDYKAVFLYSVILPFLFSEEKVQRYMQDIKTGTNREKRFKADICIDVHKEIPDCIREYLQLDNKYKIIKDIFPPKALAAVIRRDKMAI